MSTVMNICDFKKCYHKKCYATVIDISKSMTTDTFGFNIITFLKNVNCPNTTVTRYINT